MRRNSKIPHENQVQISPCRRSYITRRWAMLAKS